MDETLENIHALIMAGKYKDACRIFEAWFHHQIGSGVPPPYLPEDKKTRQAT